MKKFVLLLCFPTLIFAQLDDVLEQRVIVSANFPFKSATLLIVLQEGQNEMTRPLIVAEGFDAGSIIDPEVRFGATDIFSFENSIDRSGSTLQGLVDPTFFSRSYDLIYVNWDNGVAALQDNSEVLEAVINWVNANKAPNAAPNVLLGQSMGGVIGRYTLARMEEEQPGTNPHDVALFIAHDAPMQGANTPIGIQHFTRHLYNSYINTPAAAIAEVVIPFAVNTGLAELISDALNRQFLLDTSVTDQASPGDLLTIQDTPAAVQLNYQWVNFNEQVTTGIHEAWQEDLNRFPYPKFSRNIAISNGNECAIDHGFAPSAQLIDITAESSPEFLADLLTVLYVPLVGVLTNQIELAILSAIPGKSKFNFNFDISTSPNVGSTSRQVYFGRIRYRKNLLWIVPVQHTITERNKSAPSGVLPYDSFSGGSFNLLNVTEDLPSFIAGDVNFLQDSYGFIPVVSALDIKRNDQDVTPNDYLRTYAGGQTPEPALTSGFHNFIVDANTTAPINSEHISFQARNGNWLAAELNAINNPGLDPEIFDCSFVCEAMEIIGQPILCTEDTYTVDLKRDATVIWSAEPAGIVTPTCTSCETTSFKNAGNNGRRVTLVATVSSQECGVNGLRVTRTIDVGRPATPTSLQGPSIVNTGALVTYQGSTAMGATSYEWRLPYPYRVVTSYDYSGGEWQMRANNSYSQHQAFTGYNRSSGYIQLAGQNRCGTGGAKLLYVEHYSPSSDDGVNGPKPGGEIPLVGDPATYRPSTGIALAPNPAAIDISFGVVPVSIPDEQQPTTIYRILLYDQTYRGIVDYSFGENGLTFGSFAVPDVADGTYLVVIATDIGNVAKNLIIAR